MIRRLEKVKIFLVKKFKPEQRKALADFCVNIATAWFAGGLITPWFIKPAFSASLLIDVTGALLNTILFMFLAIKTLK